MLRTKGMEYCPKELKEYCCRLLLGGPVRARARVREREGGTEREREREREQERS